MHTQALVRCNFTASDEWVVVSFSIFLMLDNVLLLLGLVQTTCTFSFLFQELLFRCTQVLVSYCVILSDFIMPLIVFFTFSCMMYACA